MTSFFMDDYPPVSISYLSSSYSVKCDAGFQIFQGEELHLTFTGGEAYVVNEAGEKAPVRSCLLSNKESLKYVIGLKSNVTINMYNYLDQHVHSTGSVNIYGVNSISSKGYGALILSYTPTPTQYTLTSQYLRLNSKNNQLQATITLDESISSVDINGIVDEATISGMDLFPTFLGWYRDNIYLAPITLVTTIFGGATLMLNSRKKS